MILSLPRATKLLFPFLLMILVISDSSGQCNKVSGMSINSIIINDDSGCPSGMLNVTVNLSGTIGGGNPSFCVGYIPAGGTIANFVQSLCFNATVANHNATFDVPCDADMAALVAYSSPSGSGNTCSDPAPVTGGNLLPITLMSFAGKISETNRSIVLEWVTASELNNDFYSIERSGDDLQFVRLQRVSGNGTTNSLSAYTYEDIHPLSGRNYYRLVQYDLDGQFTESEIIAVNFQKDKLNDILFIRFDNMLKIVTDDVVQNLHLYTLSGQLIHNSGQKAQNEYDISFLSKGLYIARVVINDEVRSQKLYIL